MFDLQKKVAIVTGCTSGIGLATTQLLLSSNTLVFGVDIAPPKDEELLKAASGPESSFSFHQADLTRPNAAHDVVKACVTRFGGRIDILANIAGIMDGFSSASTVSDTQLDRVLDVNLKAPIKLMGAVIPIMIEQKGGSIVNVASKASFSGAAAGIAYTASKHGLVGATKQTAWRYKESKIRCNAISPGGTISNIQASISEMDMESYMTMKPFHDLGVQEPMQALEMANSIVFLASDMSTKVSGVVLPIDQAWSAA